MEKINYILRTEKDDFDQDFEILEDAIEAAKGCINLNPYVVRVSCDYDDEGVCKDHGTEAVVWSASESHPVEDVKDEGLKEENIEIKGPVEEKPKDLKEDLLILVNKHADNPFDICEWPADLEPRYDYEMPDPENPFVDLSELEAEHQEKVDPCCKKEVCPECGEEPCVCEKEAEKEVEKEEEPKEGDILITPDDTKEDESEKTELVIKAEVPTEVADKIVSDKVDVKVKEKKDEEPVVVVTPDTKEEIKNDSDTLKANSDKSIKKLEKEVEKEKKANEEPFDEEVKKKVLVESPVDEIKKQINNFIDNELGEDIKEEKVEIKEAITGDQVSAFHKIPLFDGLDDKEINKVVNVYVKLKDTNDDEVIDSKEVKPEDVATYIDDIGGWGSFVLEGTPIEKGGLTQDLIIKLTKKDPKLLDAIKIYVKKYNLASETSIDPATDEVTVTPLKDDDYILGALDVSCWEDTVYNIGEISKIYQHLDDYKDELDAIHNPKPVEQASEKVNDVEDDDFLSEYEDQNITDDELRKAGNFDLDFDDPEVEDEEVEEELSENENKIEKEIEFVSPQPGTWGVGAVGDHIKYFANEKDARDYFNTLSWKDLAKECGEIDLFIVGDTDKNVNLIDAKFRQLPSENDEDDMTDEELAEKLYQAHQKKLQEEVDEKKLFKVTAETLPDEDIIDVGYFYATDKDALKVCDDHFREYYHYGYEPSSEEEMKEVLTPEEQKDLETKGYAFVKENESYALSEGKLDEVQCTKHKAINHPEDDIPSDEKKDAKKLEEKKVEEGVGEDDIERINKETNVANVCEPKKITPKICTPLSPVAGGMAEEKKPDEKKEPLKEAARDVPAEIKAFEDFIKYLNNLIKQDEDALKTAQENKADPLVVNAINKRLETNKADLKAAEDAKKALEDELAAQKKTEDTTKKLEEK